MRISATLLGLSVAVAVALPTWVVASSVPGVLTVGSQSIPFAFSQSLQLSPDAPLTLFWNLPNSTAAASNATVQFGVRARPSSAGGWVGIGFNTRGRMTPSRAVIALQPENSSTGLVMEYNLSGKSPSQVQPVTEGSVIRDAVADYSGADGLVSFVFSIPVSAEPALILQPGKRSGIIYAVGPRPASEQQLPQHTDFGSTSLGLAGGIEAQTIGGNRRLVIAVHAVFMVGAWLILTPLGAFLASPNVRRRLFPQDTLANPRHTTAHRLVMVVVVILALFGFIIGYFYIGTRTYITHFAIGTAVLVLMLAQGALGWWRTKIVPGGVKSAIGLARFGKNNKNSISTIHGWLGRVTWSLAAVNVFFGIDAAGSLYGTAYVVAAGAIVGLGAMFFLAGPLIALLPHRKGVTVDAPSSRGPPPLPATGGDFSSAPPMASEIGFGPGGYEVLEEKAQVASKETVM